jgi:hypothetical protein
MSDFLQFDRYPWLAPLLAVVTLILVWLFVRYVKHKRSSVDAVLANISFDRIEGLVIPGADEGEIMIDQLLLTSEGLLVLEIKDVQGTVFGGDKMQDWTVITEARRYTFPNPQPALYDRIAAVRQIVRQVPVTGRILFKAGAEFTKGVPGLVCNLDELCNEFLEKDKRVAKVKVEAFKPHWDQVRKVALSAQMGELLERR